MADITGRCKVTVFIPVEDIADNSCSVTSSDRVDGEDESVVTYGVGATIVIGVTHPVVASASDDLSSGAVIDREVQGHGAVATVGASVYVRRRIRAISVISVPPSVAATSLSRSVTESRGFDSEA